MTDTIDRLIFALDGDLTALKAKYAEAEAGAQKAGAGIATNLGGGFKAAATDAATHANQIKAAINGVTTATRESHQTTSIATREFRALFDELSSGRTRMVPGTLAIIATRVFGITPAVLGLAAAIAAVPIAFTVAAVTAENMLGRIQRALLTTGYAAGVTREQILGIGTALDRTSNLSARGATDIATILASRGNIPGQNLQGATRAAGLYAEATGEKEDAAAAKFEKILSEPVKGAEELNAQFKLLDVATTRQIADMDAAGDKAGAQRLIIEAVTARMGQLEESSWSLSKAFDIFGKGLSDWWLHTGLKVTGNDMSDADRLAALKAQAQEFPANSQIGRIYSDEIRDLQFKMQDEAISARAGGLRTYQQGAIGAGMADVDKQSGEFTKKLHELDLEVRRDADAVNAAKASHSQFTNVLQDQLKAVQLAKANQRTPAQIAAQEAVDQRRIAATSIAQRPVVEAQLRAQEELRRNLANPATALQAQSIYASQMGVAGLAKSTAAGERAEDRVKVAQLEAQAELALARAYGVSTAEGLKEKAMDDAAAEAVRQHGLDVKSYASALLQKAAATAAAAEAEKLSTEGDKLAGLRAEVAATGNPQAIAMARISAAAQEATSKEQDYAEALKLSARTSLEKSAATELAKRAQDDYSRAVQQGTEQLHLNQQLEVNAKLFGAQFEASQLSARNNLASSGASPDDLRHFEVLQSTMKELVDMGITPADERFQSMLDTLNPLNERISDLNDSFKKTQQLAGDLASAITGPLDKYLTSGGKGGTRELMQGIEHDTTSALIKNEVITPLHQTLSSIFGTALGGKPDGSQQNPLYVVSSDMSGTPLYLSGANSGQSSGGLLSGIGNFAAQIFGGGKTGTAPAANDNGILSSIFGPSSSPLGSLFSAAGGIIGGLFNGKQTAGQPALDVAGHEIPAIPASKPPSPLPTLIGSLLGKSLGNILGGSPSNDGANNQDGQSSATAYWVRFASSGAGSPTGGLLDDIFGGGGASGGGGGAGGGGSSPFSLSSLLFGNSGGGGGGGGGFPGSGLFGAISSLFGGSGTSLAGITPEALDLSSALVPSGLDTALPGLGSVFGSGDALAGLSPEALDLSGSALAPTALSDAIPGFASVGADATGAGLFSGIGDAIAGGASAIGGGIAAGASAAGDAIASLLESIPLLFAADGAATNPGDAFIVGEEGPELFIADQAGQIVSNKKMRAMFGGGLGAPSPLTPPDVGHAAGSPLATNAGGSMSVAMPTSGPGGGDTYNFNFHGPTDGPSVLRSRSQISSVFTREAAAGRRNR